MSSERHNRVSELFLRACRLSVAERAAFLERACVGDPELRAEVESLLAHDGAAVLETGGGVARATSMLERAHGPAGDNVPDVERERCPSCGVAIPFGRHACPHCETHTGSGDAADSIPGYEIVGLLGVGGMGTVYLARDLTLGRRVAIKVISAEFAPSGETVQRFLREARVMAAVEHPHIVRVYSFGESENCPYLVMEYVAGQSLAVRIRSVGRLAVDDSLRIVRQTVEALEAAWEHGIVHRDVKPGNILLDTRDRVRVADFGLAKATDLSGELSITKLGQIVGTPSYVSPEQARGSKTLDFRADVYSLGIVLWEMLAGQRPFQGDSAVDVLDQHIHTPLPSLRDQRPDVPGQLEQLCEWMTRKRPDDRPASYVELRQCIEALQGTPSAVTVSGPLPAFLTAEDEDSEPLFVGRTHELARLDASLQGALAGHGQVVFVTGGSGSGKTALLAEFARRSLDAVDELIVAGGNCDAQTGIGDPYLPFREMLGLLTGDVETQRSSGSMTHRHAKRLWGILPVAVETLVKLGPDLVGTFVSGDALVARAAAFTPSPAGWRVHLEELVRRQAATPRDVTLQQSFLFEQFTRIILALTQHHPLLLHVEDLHWADGGSCSLLFHLGRRIAGHRVLIVGTYRPAEIAQGREGRRHPLEAPINELRRAYGDIEIPVGEEESREFIDALVDDLPNRLGSDFRDALYRQTRGHPLFAVELLGGMREQGVLVQDEEGRWIVGSTLTWGTMPARVEGAIGERIDRLPEELGHALSLASVQGEEFTAEVLASSQGARTGQVIRMLSRELDKRHHLVTAHGTRRIGGRRLSVYRFRHILYQKYLYGRLDDVERAYLHEEIGAALEDLYGEQVDEVAVQLARHFREAGITDKAIRYLRMAGQKAVRLSANEEAIAHFRDGLELVGSLPAGDTRPREELTLRLALGAPLLATAGPGSKELHRAYTRARELCDRVGEAPQLFQTLFILVHHHANRLDLAKALHLADQLVDLAENSEEPLPAIMAYWARGFVFHLLGRFVEACGVFDRVVELYNREQHGSLAFIFGVDPAVSALAFNASMSWYLGCSERAVAYSERAIELAERVDHPASLAHALLHAAVMRLHQRDTAAVAGHLERLVPLCEEKGVALFGAWGSFLQGCLLVEQQRVPEGLERMREGWVTIKATQSKLGYAEALCSMGRAHGLSGHPASGIALLDDAFTAVRAGADPVWEPELHRVHGELLQQMGEVDEVENCFRQALETARARGAKSFELRAAVSLGHLWKGLGRKDEAQKLLTEVYGGFTEGFATADLKDAKVLLERLS